MSFPFPESPRLGHYRRQAKELAIGARRGEAPALSFLREHHPAALNQPELKLADVQHALARSLGFPSWKRLRAAVIEAENRAFLSAVREDRLDEVRSRLRERPELARLVDDSGMSPLHYAAESGDPALAKILVEAGAEMELPYGASTHTALSWAVTVGSFGFAEELVRLGDRPDLFCAAGMGRLDWVRTFWEGGELAPRPSRTGSSRFSTTGERLPCPPETREELLGDALYMAARHGRSDVVRWLLDHGAQAGFRGFLGGSVLHWAEFSGDSATVALLRAAGVSDTSLDDEFLAVPRAFGILVPTAWGITRRLAERLEREPELANVEGGRWRPLEAAALFDQPLSAFLLLRAGADRDFANSDGECAVEIARRKGYAKVVRVLEEF